MLTLKQIHGYYYNQYFMNAACNRIKDDDVIGYATNSLS